MGSTGQSSLVVCATHEEIQPVTDAIRDKRKGTGQLGDSAILEWYVSLNWTAAQKSNPETFRPGQILGFHRAVKGIEKNESVEVIQSETNRIIVRGENGDRSITGKQAKSFDVLEARPIEVAAGDRLLITANRRESDFRATNGEIATVARRRDPRRESPPMSRSKRSPPSDSNQTKQSLKKRNSVSDYSTSFEFDAQNL